MTITELVEQDRRHGDGWAVYISPTRVLMILDDSYETAPDEALRDLGSWGRPADWTLTESGWWDDGYSYYLYQWEPVSNELVTTLTKA